MDSPAAKLAPLSGTTLGRYVLGPRLGVGGAASVYLALLRGPHTFERVLAVKVVHEHLTESPDFVNMFLDEANLSVRLTHPGIVHTYELARDGAHLFIAMEYLAGQPLSMVLERAKAAGESVPPALVAWIGAQAADALAYAHALTDDQGEPLGLVHRDVSPQNIFLTYDGRVLLIDFGIARVGRRLTQTGVGRIKGKFRYMAPEQMLREAVDGRADIFALGTTLYEAAVGALPFAADDEAEALANLLEASAPPPEARVPGFPGALGQVLLHALEREPKNRYADAGAMASELEAIVAQLGLSDPKAAVVALMSRLFAKEREQQAAAVATLKGAEAAKVMRGPMGSTVTADPTARTIRPAPASSQRRWVTPAIVAALLGVIAVVAVGRKSTEPVAARAAEARTVSLEIQVEPEVDATILVDGKTATGRRPRLALRRGTTPVEIRVGAVGFQPATLEAVPDRDQLVSVRLEPVKAKEPAVATAPAVPEAPSSRGAARGASSAAAGALPRAAYQQALPSVPPPRAAPSPKKDPLVTEYPF